MELLDLPLEILDEIIGLTLPSGIEAFALCCRAVHERAASQILRHNLLKKEWRRPEIPYEWRRDIFCILYAVSCDPLIAQYIETLSLWSPSNGYSGRNHGVRLDDEESTERVKRTVLASEFFNVAGVDAGRWWEEIIKENEDGDEYDGGDGLHTIVSLLSLLPNLKTLQLPPGWFDRRRRSDEEQDADMQLTRVLDAIVESANSNAGRGQALGKLEFLLPSTEGGYDERAGLQCLEPFMRLKSMREVYATSCIAVDDHYTGIPFLWQFPELNSSLRRLELTSCCMDADGLYELVAHTPLLSVFRYSHETKWHGCQHDWNAGAFIETLAEYCCGTLTDLAITIDELFGEVSNGITSFREFSKLQRLEVDLRIFYGPPLESGQEQGEGGMVPEGQAPWSEEDIPCLGDMLPESIVDAQMYANFQEEDEMALKALLKDFAELRRSRLKNLAQVTFKGYRFDNVRDLAKKAGVELSDYDQEGVHQGIMPVWKRSFEERVEGLSDPITLEMESSTDRVQSSKEWRRQGAEGAMT